MQGSSIQDRRISNDRETIFIDVKNQLQLEKKKTYNGKKSLKKIKSK